MPRRVLSLALLLTLQACDSGSTPAPAKTEEKGKEDADLKARLEKRAADRKAKEEAEKQAVEDRKVAVAAVATLPEGVKLPKNVAKACEEVARAQTAFMKKFHADVPEDGVTTQVGLIKKQCLGQKNVKVVMCWAHALDNTTEELKSWINEYLGECMAKYETETKAG